MDVIPALALEIDRTVHFGQGHHFCLCHRKFHLNLQLRLPNHWVVPNKNYKTTQK